MAQHDGMQQDLAQGPRGMQGRQRDQDHQGRDLDSEEHTGDQGAEPDVQDRDPRRQQEGPCRHRKQGKPGHQDADIVAETQRRESEAGEGDRAGQDHIGKAGHLAQQRCEARIGPAGAGKGSTDLGIEKRQDRGRDAAEQEGDGCARPGQMQHGISADVERDHRRQGRKGQQEHADRAQDLLQGQGPSLDFIRHVRARSNTIAAVGGRTCRETRI